ncbi:MAG TPA: DUF1990 domain-containing protein [Pyrinomonadaceae bacterium]|nr:DUF1990 domain-containing protein [Pyrinomonadaceae bacterium]
MFLRVRPSQSTIDDFLAQSLRLPLSYQPIGIAGLAQSEFRIDEVRCTLGHGSKTFTSAKEALLSWRQFDLGWVELLPHDAPIETGTVVAVMVRHLGFWSLNGCRIVYTIGDRDSATQFGFAYGTLTNHAERGEEIFEVSIDPASQEVSYRIRAASKPRATLARVGYPLTRTLQARFRRDSLAAMRRAVTPGRSFEPECQNPER